MASPSPRARLIRLAWGYRVSQGIYVAARLGIADLLSRGPRGASALARGCGADAAALGRLLRALASTGVFRELRDGRFAQSPLSRFLVQGRNPSIRNATLMWMEDHYAAWGDLLHAVRTGTSAFQRAHGASFYDFLARDRRAAARFHRAISELTSQEARAVVPDYDFGSARTIIDVGGGQGDLLSAILGSAPRASGVLFDLPAVIRAARARLRHEPNADRIRFVPGDFFRSVPRGADLILLRWVLHNWRDEDAIRILRNCRRAMTPAGRLLVIEELLPDRMRADWRHASAALGDLNMLVLLGGHERTRAEYGRLLGRAGLRLLRVVPGDGYGILETVPARPRARGRPFP
jgi:SAM-dependent methyltransferase